MKPHLGSTKIPVSSVVTGLAWFSIGLGLAELLAPRRLSKSAGMTKHNTLLRGYGLREIGTGVVYSRPRTLGPGCGPGSPATSSTWRP